jgi:Holliday junction DNA helicase RuvB
LELTSILQAASLKLETTIDEEAALAIAQRSRGTPRIALKLFKRVRDFAQVLEKKSVDLSMVLQALSIFEIDQLGLDENDRRLITAIIEKHQGGPVGLKTLAASINEEPGTIEEVLEPYLIQIGFIKRSSSGRVLSDKAYQHFGVKFPKKD